jgi:hypothetical protein
LQSSFSLEAFVNKNQCDGLVSHIPKVVIDTRCPTTDEWIKKMWYLYTMEFYSAMKENEILSFASNWMELENIILSKVNQTQKTKSDVLPHMWSLDLGQIQQCCWTWVT